MLKKYYKLIALIVILLVVAMVMYFNNSGYSKAKANISPSQLARIDQITIERKDGTLLLTKKDNAWLVDNQYKANDQSIRFFFKFLENLEIQYPAGTANETKILSTIKDNHLTAKFFSGGSLLKSYQIGSVTEIQGGTIMLIDYLPEPYVVNFPGYPPDISKIFMLKNSFWRDRLLINKSLEQISKVITNYPKKPENSFEIFKDNSSKFAVRQYNTKTEIKPVVNEKIMAYLSYLITVSFEDVTSDLENKLCDSIVRTTAECEITIEDVNGGKTTLSSFKKPVANQNFDLDNCFVKLNDEKKLYIVKYVIIDPLTKNLNYFKKQ